MEVASKEEIALTNEQRVTTRNVPVHNVNELTHSTSQFRPSDWSARNESDDVDTHCCATEEHQT